jgi:cation:H+ antiporter
MSVLKNHHDIALGNIIGSNILNLLIVMGIPPIIAPLTVDTMAFYRDYMFMAGLSVTLGVVMAFSFWINKGSDAYLNRWLGTLLLCLYVIYYCILFK